MDPNRFQYAHSALNELPPDMKPGASPASGIQDNQGPEPAYVDEDKLWAEVQRLRDAGLTIRRKEEKWWSLAWSFFNGEHWITWLNGGIQPLKSDDKPRITVNFTQAVALTRLAHLLKNKPTGVVMPATTDEEDRNAARVANKVVDSLSQSLATDKLIADAVLDTEITGNAFFKVYFDPYAGERRPVEKIQNDPLTGAPMVGPDGQPLVTVEERPIGEIVIELVHPWEILVEPGAERLDPSGHGAQKLLHRTLKPLHWVKTQFGAKAEGLRPIDPMDKSGTHKSATSVATSKFGSGEPDVSERIEVIEAWFRPNDDYPDGLHAIFAGEKLMVGEPTPQGYAAIPFVKLSEIETNNFWATTPLRNVIELNKILNVIVSQEEYRRRVQRPRALIPHESGVDETEWTNDDGDAVTYNWPHKPEYISPPPADTRAQDMRTFLHQALEDIGGSADILRGQVDGSATRSGRMVAYLQETASTVLGPPASSIERGWAAMWNMVLGLVKVKYTEERIAKNVGRNKEVEVFSYMGSDLDGSGDYVVQTGSAIPMSQAEKRDFILELMDKGHLAPERGLKILNLAEIDAVYDEDQQDRDHAEEENQAFGRMSIPQIAGAQQAGAVTPDQILQVNSLAPREFENALVHLKSHDKFRKGKVYRQLPSAVQALVDQHCDGHERFLTPDQLVQLGRPTLAMVDMAGGLPGGPPGGGGGGPGGPGPEDAPPPLPGGPGGMGPGAPPQGPSGGAGAIESGPEKAGLLPPVPPVPGPNTPGGRR